MTKGGPDTAGCWVWFVGAFALACPLSANGAASTGAKYETGLYVSADARAGHAASDSIWSQGGDSTLLDANGIVRPMFAAERGALRFSAEVDAIFQMGDTLERLQVVDPSGFVFPRVERNELVDLTTVWSEGDRHRYTLRVDRLFMAWKPDWGTVTVGRQIVTWGGGLVFNPFDLFNPFAPDDVVRDYKAGADMLLVDVPLQAGGLQVLVVSRHDEVDDQVSADASSFAAQYQFFFGSNEGAVFAAAHYGEPAVGAGLGGLLGGASWRVDGTWQRVQPVGGGVEEDYASLVANIQYSWIWGGRNVLGFLEYYYNGLGQSDYLAALADPVVRTQIGRGSLFVLGRHFGAGSLQVEVHPLVNVLVSGIVNLEDPSGIIQPRVVWNASQSMTMTVGVDVPFGKTGTEYGGIEIPGTGLTTRSPTSVYCLATWFF